jgi:MFS family permease
MASIISAGTRTLFRHHPFLYYFAARGLSKFCFQVGAVAVGWQIYALTNSAAALGMVGLVQFIPTVLLTFVAGYVADRYDRRRVAQLAQLTAALSAAYLAWGSFAGWMTVPQIFVAVGVFGAAIAFESPAAAAILPGVVPEGMLQRGAALSTGMFQIASISGPALGGVIYAFGPGVPYTIMASLWLAAALLTAAIELDRPIAVRKPSTLRDLFAGLGFVRRNGPILGSISLDEVRQRCCRSTRATFCTLGHGASAYFVVPRRSGLC